MPSPGPDPASASSCGEPGPVDSRAGNMDAPVSIRFARPADAAALAELAARSFRETFEDDNEPRNMESYIRDFFSARRVAAELVDPSNSFLLASVDGTGLPSGYAKLRRGAVEPCVRGARAIELERIYVERGMIGRGVGAALMRASLETAAERGFETLWLGVWERNERAIRFYERW